MTFIFDVMTWGREGTKVEGMLTSRLGYGIEFYRGPEFGLQLLMDTWFQGYGASDIDKRTAEEFEECFELFLGKKVWTDEDGNLLDQDTKEPLRPKVRAADHYADRLDSASGFADGHHYLVLRPRSDEFLERTAAIIASFAIEGGEGGERADFTIEVTDPKYLAHMEKNRYFQTAFTGHLP
jgi:hypothetical protein